MCKASSCCVCPAFQPVTALFRVLQSERQALASELAATKKDLSAAQHRLEHTEGNHRDASSELTALRTQLQELQVASATLQQEVKIKDGLHQHATEMLESESTKTVSWRWCACVARGLVRLPAKQLLIARLRVAWCRTSHPWRKRSPCSSPATRSTARSWRSAAPN